MAIPESPLTAAAIAPIIQTLPRIESALQKSSVAVLVAAVVSARGRPTSISEVLQIHEDIFWSIYPTVGQGRYEEWAKTKEDRLNKVWT